MIPSMIKKKLTEIYPEGYSVVSAGGDGTTSWTRVKSKETDSTMFVMSDLERNTSWVQVSFTVDGYEDDAE